MCERCSEEETGKKREATAYVYLCTSVERWSVSVCMHAHVCLNDFAESTQIEGLFCISL